MKNILITVLFAVGLMNCTKSNTDLNNSGAELLDLSQAQKDSIRLVQAQMIVDSANASSSANEAVTSSNRTAANENAQVANSSAGTTTPTSTKKQWSNKKKGVIIGAASGAVVGAVVSEKRGKGAIIGGVVGGGVGLGAGAILDNKEKKNN